MADTNINETQLVRNVNCKPCIVATVLTTLHLIVGTGFFIDTIPQCHMSSTHRHGTKTHCVCTTWSPVPRLGRVGKKEGEEKQIKTGTIANEVKEKDV